MNKFYKDSLGIYHFETSHEDIPLTPSNYQTVFSGETISLQVINSRFPNFLYKGKISELQKENNSYYSNKAELLTALSGFFANASVNDIGGILGTISASASAPTPSKSGYYFFHDFGAVSYLEKSVKPGDILVVVYDEDNNTYTYSSVIDTNRVDTGTILFLNGQASDIDIEDGTVAFPFKKFSSAINALTDLTKSYTLICSFNDYVETEDATIPAVKSLVIYGNDSTLTIPNVTVACHHSIYNLNTFANINYTYNGNDRSVRDNGKIVGNVTISGGFPHIQNLNFTGIMTITGGTPYIKDITGGGRLINNGGILILSNPNLDMPTVDAANVTILSGQFLCHGGLMVNKGTTLPNIVISNANTPSTPHSMSDLTCNTGINAGTTAYTIISPSVLSPIIVGTLLLYLPSDTRSQFGAGGGTAQAQTVTLPSTITSYFYGMVVRYIPIVSNTGAAPTVAVNTLGTKSTKRGLYNTSDTIVAGDFTAGKMVELIYDGTVFRLMNPISLI